MAYINDISVVDRHNRPGVLERVMLRTFFINNGQYADPYAISSVAIFTRASNSTPCSILTEANEVSATPLMAFKNFATLVSASEFDASNYTPGISENGIHKLGVGQYAVVLDGTVDLEGEWNGESISNAASAVGNYIDVWIVKLTEGSDWTVLINTFDLYSQTFVTTTEPLIFRANAHLQPNKVVLGSKIDLQVAIDLAIANKGIEAPLKNIIKNACITSAMIEIKKNNEGNNLPNYTVSSFSDTSSYIDMTGDNTLLFNWDTSQLAAKASNSSGQMGNITGIYLVQAKFTVFNQTIITPQMPVRVSLV